MILIDDEEAFITFKDCWLNGLTELCVENNHKTISNETNFLS